MSIAILVLAVLALVAGIRFIQSGDESDAGCPRVRSGERRRTVGRLARVRLGEDPSLCPRGRGSPPSSVPEAYSQR